MRIGRTKQKVLLLLLTGVVLGLSRNPLQHIYVWKHLPKNLLSLDKVNLQKSIECMRKDRLIKLKKRGDEYDFVLTCKGKKYALREKVKVISLTKDEVWDGVWRIVIFDIPEKYRFTRDLFRKNLKRMGLYEMQKSVWFYPYLCKKEIKKIVKCLNIDCYVHLIESDSVDSDKEPRKFFKI